MSDSSWENEGGSKISKGLSSWLKYPLILLAVLAGLAVFLVSKATSTRRQAWPITQQVFTRLATDENARNLYAANPALSRVYESSEDFVESLRGWRPRLGTLPATEPRQSRETYLCSGGIDNLRVSVKGSGGAWMTVTIVKPTFVPHSIELGEGITDLGFAEDLTGLRARRRSHLRHVYEKEAQIEWIKFREIADGLGTDEGVDRLLLDHPELPQAQNPEPFKAKARAWRRHLEALPLSFDGARDSAEIRRQITLGSTTCTISYRFSQGGRLVVTWKNGKLTALDPLDE